MVLKKKFDDPDSSRANKSFIHFIKFSGKQKESLRIGTEVFYRSDNEVWNIVFVLL